MDSAIEKDGTKRTFYSSVIEENKSNQTILFTAVDKMLNRLAPKKITSKRQCRWPRK